MKQIKLVLKRVLIVYVVLFITFSQMSSSFARKYDDQCGEYVSKYARDFIAKYCAGKSTVYDASTGYAFFTGGSIGKGTFHACCSSGVHLMYKEALGVDIYKYGFNALCSTAQSQMLNSPNWKRVLASDLKPGDILISSSHTEMYIGNHQNANFGNSPRSGKISGGPRLGSEFNYAFRPTFDVNPTGSVPKSAKPTEERLSIYDENGFIYTGVAKIKGYNASLSYGKWIIKSLLEILDYIIGIFTLIFFRIIVVGWIAIFERFVVDGIVNAITGVTNKRDESWEKDPNSLDEVDKELLEEQEKEKSQNSDTGSKATGNENEPNEYISEGMQNIADIGGKVQLKTESSNNVTLENILYNKIPILDANFFNFERAGGAAIDEDGIVYLLKESIAMWYYIFRILAILAMLVILIYLGIRMAISTVAEKKAVYKQMMTSWIMGFLLVFFIHYAMYVIFAINESFIHWITPRYEDGIEISLYETVRSKAYELKATAGFSGMIMYGILVYYAIRFLLVYLRRYFAIAILALISPFMCVYYTIQRINGKGKGGQVYKNWFKDFLYSVWIQSIHALIYTIFVKTALDLTETNVLGIALAFFVLGFMIKIDKVVRDIFGLGGQNKSELVVGKIGTQLAVASYVGSGIKKVGAGYGNLFGKMISNSKSASSASRPRTAYTNRIGNSIQQAKNDVLQKFGIDPEDIENAKKDRERRKRQQANNRKKVLESAALGFQAGTGVILTGVKAVAAIPVFIAEPEAGIHILSSAISSWQKTSKLLDKVKNDKVTLSSPPGRYKLKGIKPKNSKSARKLRSNLNKSNIKFKEVPGGTTGKSGTTGTTGKSKTSSTRRFTGTELKDIKVSKHTVGQIKRIIEKDEVVAVVVHLDENIVNKLSDNEKQELIEKLGEEDLSLAQTNIKPSDILNKIAEEGDVKKLEALTEVLEEAKEKEKDLEQLYKEITGKDDIQIEEAEKISHEFAASLQRKKAQKLNREAYIMSQPLSEKDIANAIKNYQSKVPQFNPDQARLSSQDIKGITEEINAILEKKGFPIEMSKEFIKKAEKELVDSHRRNKAKKESMEAQAEARRNVGSDVRHKADQESVSEKTNGIEESINDFKNSENVNSGAKSRRNGKNNIDDLVKKIQKSSRGTQSKTPRQNSGISSRTILFSKKLEDLLELGEEAEELSGEELYTLENVLKRLEEI